MEHKEREGNTMTDNPCIEELAVTTVTKKVIKGTLKASEWGGKCSINPIHGGVVLDINTQSFSKGDLKHLIDSLSEIQEMM